MQSQKANENMKMFFENLLNLKMYIYNQYESSEDCSVQQYILSDIYDRLDKIIKEEE
jgi:hypothetical protein